MSQEPYHYSKSENSKKKEKSYPADVKENKHTKKIISPYNFNLMFFRTTRKNKKLYEKTIDKAICSFLPDFVWPKELTKLIIDYAKILDLSHKELKKLSIAFQVIEEGYKKTIKSIAIQDTDLDDIKIPINSKRTVSWQEIRYMIEVTRQYFLNQKKAPHEWTHNSDPYNNIPQLIVSPFGSAVVSNFLPKNNKSVKSLFKDYQIKKSIQSLECAETVMTNYATRASNNKAFFFTSTQHQQQQEKNDSTIVEENSNTLYDTANFK